MIDTIVSVLYRLNPWSQPVGTDDWRDCSDLDCLQENVISHLRTPVAEPRRMVMKELRVLCD